jgi:hypothetical protein
MITSAPVLFFTRSAFVALPEVLQRSVTEITFRVAEEDAAVTVKVAGLPVNPLTVTFRTVAGALVAMVTETVIEVGETTVTVPRVMPSGGVTVTVAPAAKLVFVPVMVSVNGVPPA